MVEINEISRLLSKAKTGRASKETQIYLSKFFELQADNCWKRFIGITHKGKTEKQLVTEFLAVQTEAKIINHMNETMVMNQVEGSDAEEKMRIIREEIKKETDGQ